MTQGKDFAGMDVFLNIYLQLDFIKSIQNI